MTTLTTINHILLVDADRSLVEVVSMALEDAGFEVRVAHDGKHGWAAFCQSEPDLVILDLLMPELDGLELCKLIRAEHRTPIVMLTSRNHEMDKVLGLELGADDYVTKPFSIRELIARIKATLRRVHMERPAAATQCAGPLCMNQSSREVRVRETVIELTATEFDLLWALMSRPGHVYDRASLIDIVYGEDIVVADRTIDTFIKRIRRKLADVEASLQPIETIRAVGYRFQNPDS
jgi:DNA-binding response OmpR family regulator